jgi:hypothetical protein
MKLYLAILLVILAVAVADKDDDFLWKSFKVFSKFTAKNSIGLPYIHSKF